MCKRGACGVKFWVKEGRVVSGCGCQRGVLCQVLGLKGACFVRLCKEGRVVSGPGCKRGVWCGVRFWVKGMAHLEVAQIVNMYTTFGIDPVWR